MKAKWQKRFLKIKSLFYNLSPMRYYIFSLVLSSLILSVASYSQNPIYLILVLIPALSSLFVWGEEEEKKFVQRKMEEAKQIRKQANEFVTDNQSKIWRVARIIPDGSFKEILFDRQDNGTRKRFSNDSSHFALLAVDDSVVFELISDVDSYQGYRMDSYLIPKIVSPVKS